MKRYNVRITPKQHEALVELSRRLGPEAHGQRGPGLSPLLQWLGDTAAGAMDETVWLLHAAAGDDLDTANPLEEG